MIGSICFAGSNSAPEMALFKWLASASPGSLTELLASDLDVLGLEINELVSTDAQLYASDPIGAEYSCASRLRLFVAWTDRVRGELQFELMSDEPLVRSGTRCELTAAALLKSFPPLKSCSQG